MSNRSFLTLLAIIIVGLITLRLIQWHANEQSLAAGDNVSIIMGATGGVDPNFR